MRIGFLIYPTALINPGSNGIRSQALSWKAGLEELGHEVFLVSSWDAADFGALDVIHLFGPGFWLAGFAAELDTRHPRLVLSPILDTTKPRWLYALSSVISLKKIGFVSNPGLLRQIRPLIKTMLVRSKHEESIFVRALGYSPSNVRKVLLGCRFDHDAHESIVSASSRSGVLHVSSLYQRRKNVVRLIEACEQLGVPLRLVGALREQDDGAAIKRLLATAKWTKYLGFLSDHELMDEYRKARVFCLPSIYEGVGLVALEAAALGCDVVITRNGGPPDYFGPHAEYVDPRSVPDIKNKLQLALAKTKHPALSAHIRENHSLQSSCRALAAEYARACTPGDSR